MFGFRVLDWCVDYGLLLAWGWGGGCGCFGFWVLVLGGDAGGCDSGVGDGCVMVGGVYLGLSVFCGVGII